MKACKNRLKLAALMLILAGPTITFGQVGLTGSWKYVSQIGEMTMQITASTIVMNSQSFSYKAQGNVLMINEGTTTTPYPYMLDGDQLTLEFPGGMEVVFTRVRDGAQVQNQLPQSMSRPSDGIGKGQQASTFSGRWVFQNQQGQLVLEFLSASQLSFNGEKTQYQLKEGVIQAMGDYGWIDYPYNLSQGKLVITFPDGTQIPFARTSSATTNQQNTVSQASGGNLTWQLQGMLCSYSGSSGGGSSYSSTNRISFDGRGNFQYGRESSFSGDAGIAYSGNPNVQRGTYMVEERFVTLQFQSGESYRVEIKIRQDDGRITCIDHDGTLYATSLCD